MRLPTILSLILIELSQIVSFAQCPTSGTISSNCTTTGNMNVTGGTLTVNSGVVVTVTGTLTVRAGATLTGTGATFTLGNLADAYGGTNTITGGTYNTGGFTAGGGGNFTMSNATVTISPEVDVSLAGSTITLTNTTITGVEDWSLNVSSSIFTETDITASGDIEFEDAAISGGTFTAGTSVSFASGTSTFDGSTIDAGTTNSGTTGVTAMSFNGGATVTFNNNSQVDVRGDVNGGNGADLFIDDSDVRITGNFDNVGSGTVEVRNDGTLVVEGDFDNSGGGSVSSEDGGFVQVDGDYDNSGGGNTDVDGGTFVVGGGYDGDAPTGDTGDCEGGSGGCCGSGCGALPVSLVDFSSRLNQSEIQLNWSTASELNNDFFTIERSMNGVEFNEIARISGCGNTDELKVYSFRDEINFDAAYVYYRLSQTDYDGTHEKLKTNVISLSELHSKIQIFPNPVLRGEKIRVAGLPTNTSWALYDLSGQIVNSDILNLNNTIDSSNIPLGTYLIVFMENGQVRKKRIVVK